MTQQQSGLGAGNLGDALRDSRPGDPLRQSLSSMWRNYVTQAAKKVNGSSVGMSGQGPSYSFQPSTVLIQNNTGSNLVSLSIVGFDGGTPCPPSSSISANAANFLMQSPVLTMSSASVTAGNPFGILVAPLAINTVGMAIVSGVSACMINMGTNATPVRVDSGTASSQFLIPNSSGRAEVLWCDTPVSGTAYAVVRLGDPAPTGVFPVTLETTGGGNPGDATSQATIIYNVMNAMTGAMLATAVSPIAPPNVWQRPSVGYMIAATAGLAYYNSTGALVLTWINEVADQEACTNTATTVLTPPVTSNADGSLTYGTTTV